jgi:hypothetical protein
MALTWLEVFFALTIHSAEGGRILLFAMLFSVA